MTPLRAVTVHADGRHAVLRLKLEQHQPTGSIKYRTALGLIDSLHADRPLERGTTVVESTSGNLGVALARVLRERECHLVAVVDVKCPPAVLAALDDEGVEVVRIDSRDKHGAYLLTRLAAVRDLLASDPDLRWANQYGNPANPHVHEETLAPEIVDQTAGAIDAVYVAVSTGGTAAGVSKGLVGRGVDVYAVDVRGSLVLSEVAHPHLLTGIGATRRSSFLQRSHYKNALIVRDVEAFAHARMLEQDTGIAIGGSGGAVLAAFISSPQWSARCPVAIIADGADRYRETFYSDDWLAVKDALAAVRESMESARRRGLVFEVDDA